MGLLLLCFTDWWADIKFGLFSQGDRSDQRYFPQKPTNSIEFEFTLYKWQEKYGKPSQDYPFYIWGNYNLLNS